LSLSYFVFMLQSVTEALLSSQLPQKIRSLVIGGRTVHESSITAFRFSNNEVLEMEGFMRRYSTLNYMSLTIAGCHWDSYHVTHKIKG
jgi:hypothetical protein